jgi:hypothetical protein
MVSWLVANTGHYGTVVPDRHGGTVVIHRRIKAMATYRQTKYEVMGDVSEYDFYGDDDLLVGTVEVVWDAFGGLDVTVQNSEGFGVDEDKFAQALGFADFDDLFSTLEENVDTTRTRPEALMVLGGAK